MSSKTGSNPFSPRSPSNGTCWRTTRPGEATKARSGQEKVGIELYSSDYLRKLYAAFRKGGVEALVDSLSKSGNRTSQFRPEEQALLMEIVTDSFLTTEQKSIKAMALRARSASRKTWNRDTVFRVIDDIETLETPPQQLGSVRRHGHVAVGQGNITSVPTRCAARKKTRGIVLVEAAGGGKTTSIRKVLADAPCLKENPETGQPRYLEIQVPSPATLKSVGLEILQATGMTGLSERTTA